MGAMIADIIAKVVGGVGGGIASFAGASQSLKALKRTKIGYGMAAGPLSQALSGRAVSRQDIAPQVAAVTEQGAQTRRGLLEGLQGSAGTLSTSGVGSAIQGVTRATGEALRNVYAEQSRMNLAAQQAGIGHVLGVRKQQAAMDAQRTAQRAQLKGQKVAGIIGAISASGQEAGESVALGLAAKEVRDENRKEQQSLDDLLEELRQDRLGKATPAAQGGK